MSVAKPGPLSSVGEIIQAKRGPSTRDGLKGLDSRSLSPEFCVGKGLFA